MKYNQTKDKIHEIFNKTNILENSLLINNSFKTIPVSINISKDQPYIYETEWNSVLLNTEILGEYYVKSSDVFSAGCLYLALDFNNITEDFLSNLNINFIFENNIDYLNYIYYSGLEQIFVDVGGGVIEIQTLAEVYPLVVFPYVLTSVFSSGHFWLKISDNNYRLYISQSVSEKGHGLLKYSSVINKNYYDVSNRNIRVKVLLSLFNSNTIQEKREYKI